MLAYILAIAVGLGSFALYMAAFFFPEVHRKDDFLWSGVGLFYALVLWVCAGRLTGGVLLGQIAGVSLLFWFGWETLRLRRAIAHPEEITDLEGFSLTEILQKRFAEVFQSSAKPQPEAVIATTETISEPTIETEALRETSPAEVTETLVAGEPEVTISEAEKIATTVDLEIEEELAETETELTPEVAKKPSFSFIRLIEQVTSPFRKDKSEFPDLDSETEELEQSETDSNIVPELSSQAEIDVETSQSEVIEPVIESELPESSSIEANPADITNMTEFDKQETSKQDTSENPEDK